MDRFIIFIIGGIVGVFIMCLLQINKEKKDCLHCGKGGADYCEKCYQELISKNAKLQKRLDTAYKITNEYIDCKKILDKVRKSAEIEYKNSIEKHIPHIN